MEKAVDKVINEISNFPGCSFHMNKMRFGLGVCKTVHPTLCLRTLRTQTGVNSVASVMEGKGKEHYCSVGERGMLPG